MTARVEPIALSQVDAAVLVGLSEREIRRAIADGELGVHYRGRKCLVDYQDLMAWYRALPMERLRR